MNEKELKKIIEEFCDKTKLDINVSSVKLEDNNIFVDLETSEPGFLIGKGGQNLIDIQHLLKIILKKKITEDFILDVDINSYKKKKKEYLEETAINLADEVVLTKKEKTLEPMSAYERKIIHLVLAKRNDVITESIGEGLERRIVIKVKPQNL